MNDTLKVLYDVVMMRKESNMEGSYTCYLFDQGLDKILKKVAEESGEVIIAAKNKDNAVTSEEICDLIYHLIVMMANEGITVEDINEILEKRAQKIGNLKTMHISDHNS